MMIQAQRLAIRRETFRIFWSMMGTLLVASSSLYAGGPNQEVDFPPSPQSVSIPTRQLPIPQAERLYQDKPLSSLKASIKPIKPVEGDYLPTNHAALRLAEFGVLFDNFDDSRPWIIAKSYEWDAPATRYLPLFYEEANLERLGYTQRCFIDACGYETDPLVAEVVQPVVSGVKFLANTLIIPYKMGVQPPDEPIYTLGVDRTGSPVYYREHNLPLSLKGMIFQAGAVCTLVFAIP